MPRSRKNRSPKGKKGTVRVGASRSVYNKMGMNNSSASVNRNFAGTQTYLKLSSDNLRALSLFANDMVKFAKEKSEDEDFGMPNLSKHFVNRLTPGGYVFDKTNIDKEFPELVGNTVQAPKATPNRKAQLALVNKLIEIKTKLYAKSTGYKNARITKTLDNLKKHFSKGVQASTSNSSKSKSASSTSKIYTANNNIPSLSNGTELNLNFIDDSQELGLQNSNSNICTGDIDESMKRLAQRVKILITQCARDTDVDFEEAKEKLLANM
jgi:hypothetical protein